MLHPIDYPKEFKERNLDKSREYPADEIGMAKLFHDIHSDRIAFINEEQAYYSYDNKGGRWQKDENGRIHEQCKEFIQALNTREYDANGATVAQDGGYKEFTSYVSDKKFYSYSKRKSLLADVRSIAPKSIVEFDTNPLLFNCQNGVYDLDKMEFRSHDPADYITKVAQVRYDKDARCERLEKFIMEIMDGDSDLALFLQKALGYCLSGETLLECLFILYGKTTRNGKSTLMETIAYLLGDYSMTIQPQTLARRSGNGAAASPDIVRLKGARLVTMPEPEKGLKLDAALVKQVTGGDSISGRLLFQNPIEFRPDFKIFINTNHLPKISDSTVFESGRIKVIPFKRHFLPSEQDKGLKKELRKPENMSGILNWLIKGYQMLRDDILQYKNIDVPSQINSATEDYKADTSIYNDYIDDFFRENLEESVDAHTKTLEVYKKYVLWAKDTGVSPMRIQDLVAELRNRYKVTRDSAKGNVVNAELKK